MLNRIRLPMLLLALGWACAPSSASAAGLTFAVYGGSDGAAQTHAALARGVAGLSPDFVIHTGNMVPPELPASGAAAAFEATAQPILAACDVLPVPGPSAADRAIFRSLRDAPGRRFYYSFDAANAHVVVLDTELTGGPHAAMVEWLRQDLAVQRSTWTVVFCHRPIFCVARSSGWGVNDVLPLLEEAGVDLVVAGGSHIYERFVPIGPAGEKPLVHVVCGRAGGRPDAARRSPLLANGFGYAGDHFCLFRIDGQRLEMTMRRAEGSVLDRLVLEKAQDAYQHEVMDAAVPTGRALVLAPLFADLDVRFHPFPEPGQKAEMRFSGERFPQGSTVTISALAPAPNPWRPQASAGGWQMEAQALRAADQMTVQLTAPADMTAGPGGFSPDLWVRLEVEHAGRTYVAEHVHVPLTDEVMAAAVPAPVPVGIPRGPDRLFVDGAPDDWDGIPAVACPYNGGKPGSVKLCWREDGLYGMAVVEDDSVTGDPELPYRADGLTLFLDRAGARRLSKRPEAMEICMGPAPSRGYGPGNVWIAYGGGNREARRIRTSWRPTQAGWNFEFMVPADVLEPARLEPGAVLNLNFVLDDDGEHVQSFYSNPSEKESWRSPVRWGAVLLEQ